MGNLLFWLVAAHFVLDYPLQGDTTAREKNPNSTTELQKHVPWYYWMAAHAFSHGAAVAFITGHTLLGCLETILHFAIDYGKCRNMFGIHQDQILHLACKGLWLIWVIYA